MNDMSYVGETSPVRAVNPGHPMPIIDRGASPFGLAFHISTAATTIHSFISENYQKKN